MANNPVDLYFRSCRAILNLKTFVFYFPLGGEGVYMYKVKTTYFAKENQRYKDHDRWSYIKIYFK